MTRALIVVPPLVKYSNGPLLGPAMLAAAARARDHAAHVLDLNARFLSPKLAKADPCVGVVGDHNKPTAALREIEHQFVTLLGSLLPSAGTASSRVGDPVLGACFPARDLVGAAERLVGLEFGHWLRRQMEPCPEPDVIAVSILFGGQIVPALAVSILARQLWPRASILWGGPHATAIQASLSTDTELAALPVDAFAVGYAESSFADALDAVGRGQALPAAMNRLGCRELSRAEDDADLEPVFEDLAIYGPGRITLPAQTSRGCAYGRCRFCTYPEVEGSFRRLGLSIALLTVERAERLGADVSFKDSLLPPEDLADIADEIRGRIEWSACTKLHARIVELAPMLAAGGCRTLEFGVETLVPGTQDLIAKRQSEALLRRTLEACSNAKIFAVLNYMTGLPYEDECAAADGLARTSALAREHSPYARVEHNVFQLERLAPLVRDVRVTQSWPLASLLDWQPLVAPRRLHLAMPRHIRVPAV